LNKIVSIKTISLFLAFILIAGTTITVSVDAQQQSKSPFVTKNDLQAALDNLVTQDQLQDTEDELQTSIAHLQLRQNQMQAALDNLVTKDQLQDTEDELQTSIAQLQLRQNQLQTSLADMQTQLQDVLANAVTQNQLQDVLANVVTQEDLVEGFYTVAVPITTADPFPPHDLLTSNAKCEEGDIVVSGGVSINGGSSPFTFQRIESLSSNPLSNDEGWTSSILATSGVSISTTALCFNTTT
jgi:hypothetical protein